MNSGKVKGVVLLLYGRSMAMVGSCYLKGPTIPTIDLIGSHVVTRSAMRLES